ncbi:MAG: universal stress protein [Herpetosiphon sp.]
MQLLLYAGPAPGRDLVLQFSQQLVQQVAANLTLVTGGGSAHESMLQEAVEQLKPPANVVVTMRALPGSAQAAMVAAAHEQPFDVVIFGQLHQPLVRLFPRRPGHRLARRLEPSVLRVHGVARPIQRILVASGGDSHTFSDVEFAARIASPLNAAVTVLHVLGPQALLMSGRSRRTRTIDDFLDSDAPEASTLRAACKLLQDRGIPAYVKGRVGPVLDEIGSELRAGNYDLLLIGAHRVASALDRILLEDITNDLLDISRRPVLIVKGDPHPIPPPPQ